MFDRRAKESTITSAFAPAGDNINISTSPRTTSKLGSATVLVGGGGGGRGAVFTAAAVLGWRPRWLWSDCGVVLVLVPLVAVVVAASNAVRKTPVL